MGYNKKWLKDGDGHVTKIKFEIKAQRALYFNGYERK